MHILYTVYSINVHEYKNEGFYSPHYLNICFKCQIQPLALTSQVKIAGFFQLTGYKVELFDRQELNHTVLAICTYQSIYFILKAKTLFIYTSSMGSDSDCIVI